MKRGLGYYGLMLMTTQIMSPFTTIRGPENILHVHSTCVSIWKLLPRNVPREEHVKHLFLMNVYWYWWYLSYSNHRRSLHWGNRGSCLGKKKLRKNKIKIKKPGVFNLENNTSQYYWLVVLNRVFWMVLPRLAGTRIISCWNFELENPYNWALCLRHTSMQIRNTTLTSVVYYTYFSQNQLVLFHANDLFPPYEGWKHGTEPPWQKTVLMG